ncbi:MAG: CobB/CobQ domain-containing protein glutamine amidotransferase [Fusobacteria bacterium]|nr:MAG: CobB/CobQ domain-containing protein glutamine amidotransferase [Fusobacteriota bacterium]KAF0228482.1 MAG: CobB/CobQ domain-containing protein glutamine [Fusobacteriota bacterium]
MDSKIVIGHLFKEQLNAFGDGGNVDVLKARLKERKIPVEIIEYAINENIDFDELDLIYIGGGRNREKRLVVDCLRGWSEELQEYIESGRPLFLTGSSLSMFGKASINDKEEIPGLGILDIVTVKLEDELEGQVVINSVVDGKEIALIGYQNIKETYLHDYDSLVNKGDSKEGLLHKGIIATSLHGPVLAKNSELADILIKRALEKKMGNLRLINLNDHIENKLKKAIKNNV